MRQFKILLLLLCFLFACLSIQANEKKMVMQQNLSFMQINENNVSINNSLHFFAAHSGGGSISQGTWLIIGGVLFTLTGACGIAGGSAMIYINADGAHINNFDDKTFRVEYWNGQQSTGWALWGVGIGITTLSSIMFISGIALLIAGVITVFSGGHARAFIESEPKIENASTSVGISIKLGGNL
jgi:hypothetical protein